MDVRRTPLCSDGTPVVRATQWVDSPAMQQRVRHLFESRPVQPAAQDRFRDHALADLRKYDRVDPDLRRIWSRRTRRGCPATAGRPSMRPCCQEASSRFRLEPALTHFLKERTRYCRLSFG